MSFSFSKYRFLNKGLVCARDPILAIVRTALFWRTINDDDDDDRLIKHYSLYRGYIACEVEAGVVQFAGNV